MYFGSRFAWVLLAVGCVLTVVFFPAPVHNGPFNTVYGPATDLRSSIDVQQAFPLMVATAVVARFQAPFPPTYAEALELPSTFSHFPISAHCAKILRC